MKQGGGGPDVVEPESEGARVPRSYTTNLENKFQMKRVQGKLKSLFSYSVPDTSVTLRERHCFSAHHEVQVGIIYSEKGYPDFNSTIQYL